MTLDFAAGALQGLELCLAPMPLSQLVLREGKAELGRLRRIYAFAGWRRDCLRYCQVLYESIVQPVPIHADSLTVLYFEDVQTICNTESGRTNVFFIFFYMNVFHKILGDEQSGASNPLSGFIEGDAVPWHLWQYDSKIL